MDIDKLKKDLINDEGYKLKLYECTAGKLTIGVGRNIEDRGISTDEAELMLQNDIRIVEAELDKALPWWRKLDEVRQRALANMAFNLGLPTLLKFKDMLKHLQDGCWNDAANSALDSQWARQVGRRALRIALMFREGRDIK